MKHGPDGVIHFQIGDSSRRCEKTVHEISRFLDEKVLNFIMDRSELMIVFCVLLVKQRLGIGNKLFQ